MCELCTTVAAEAPFLIMLANVVGLGVFFKILHWFKRKNR